MSNVSNYIWAKLTPDMMRWLNILSSSGKNRSETFAIAFGYVMSRRLSLPMQEVEDIEEFYRNEHYINVITTVDRINNITPFLRKLATKCCKGFYTLRYHNVYPRAVPITFNKDTAILDFFGIQQYLCQDTIRVISEDPENLMHYIDYLNRILDEVNKHFHSTPVEDEEEDIYVAQ